MWQYADEPNMTIMDEREDERHPFFYGARCQRVYGDRDVWTSFLDWEMKHEALRNTLANYSPHEECSIILKALPEHWKKRVGDHEKKLRSSSHWVRISRMALSARQVRDMSPSGRPP